MIYLLVVSTVLFFLAVVASALKSILVDDIKLYAPKIAHYLIRKAANKLHEDLRDQYYEIWLADFYDTPEITAKIWNALTLYFYGAGRITAQYRTVESGQRFYDLSKRIFDIVFVLPSIILFAVPFLMYAAVTKVLGQKVFDNHEAIGLGGRRVTLYRLRIKAPNCDEIFAKFLKENPNPTDYEIAIFLKNGEHLSSHGKIIRNLGLTYLPQVYNVLVGHLSIIGPCPEPAGSKNVLDGSLYVKQRPGMIGAWVEHGFRNVTESEISKIDDDYYLNRSFKNDLKLMVKVTVIVSIRLAKKMKISRN